MADKLKSAYELAMERLKKKDAERGVADPEKLTAQQKQQIAELRQEYTAKLAEREILYQSEQQAARGDPEAMERLEKDYRRDRDYLLSQREARIREVKEAGNS